MANMMIKFYDQVSKTLFQTGETCIYTFFIYPLLFTGIGTHSKDTAPFFFKIKTLTSESCNYSKKYFAPRVDTVGKCLGKPPFFSLKKKKTDPNVCSFPTQ